MKYSCFYRTTEIGARNTEGSQRSPWR